MKEQERLFLVCLSAASMIFGAAAPGVCLGSGGEYQLDSSVVTNGGGGWINTDEYAARGAIGQMTTAEAPETGGKFTNRAGFYGTPYLTYQKGLPAVLTLKSGEVSVSLPANSVTDREMFDIGINREDLRSTFLVDMATVESANKKIAANQGAWAQPALNTLTEMYVFDEQSLNRDQVEKSGVLTMKYLDSDNDGIIDGTDPPVRVDTLNAWSLDEKTKLWIQLPSMGVDPANKTITSSFRGPGVYNMVGAMADTTKNVYSYPVPFRPNGPNAGPGDGQTGTAATGITFTSTPQSGNISIYTLDGQLVRKIDIATSPFGTVKWDVKNNSGSKVASGVYIWRVVSGSNSKTGKLMVIW